MAISLPDLFEQHIATIIELVTDDAVAATRYLPVPAPREVIRGGVSGGMYAILQDLRSGGVDAYQATWEPIGMQLASDQAPLDAVLGSILRTEEIVVGELAPFVADTNVLTRELFTRIHQICNAARTAMFRIFSDVREATIRAQSAALLELAAPIIPIYSGVLVLPLVGAVDTQRASTIMETLLEGVAERNAKVVLLDITGVPVVDTSVAHYLIQSAQAVRLLGAEIALVGIRPEIAQTIVQLGVDLSGIVTMADLQGGIAYAFERLDLMVASRR